ncbi:protein phosphatase CheZ [Pseudoduganella sp. SL102]|uniref:Protein phosphatase CheZ n=1 Tax=Pseudoduganella albidiflava TaxID=321983 RepID=A0A411WW21_9BURK|nr:MULTISPECIES: protein phosphatase CheZ [Pseudoduganella]QBI00687.1 protein phosphatase CheZ [Pseudoduganella albidiflava]WBS01251.1 protein phosphatase CheZ [Pseudoduganella sp. SL102]GGY31375.1 protein phosphatase CheZ [Pseudoduganella albidiflava]
MVEQAGGAVVNGADPHEEFLARIGHMTRALHENLRGLGLDKLIEKAAEDIPDARDRLDYVARLSEDAAQKVLNATDEAGPLQDRICSDAKELSGAWQALLDGQGNDGNDSAEWRALAQRTIASLAATTEATGATKGHLMDIMMAQDFQDLTGQVIKRVTAIAQNLEKQLVQTLIDFAPEQLKKELDTGLLNGPQIDKAKDGVVADQSQVDDLLDSLGF